MPDALKALAAFAQSPVTVPERPTPMTEVTWHSVDLRSGRRGAPVRTKQGGLGTVSRILSEATETSLDILMEDNGEQVPDWEVSTEPAQVMLVAVDQSDRPIWGGMVYRRIADAGSWASLSLVTVEAYLDRRYIDANFTYTNQDQTSVIAAGVVGTTLTDGIQFTIDAPYSNWLRDREYLVDDDKTVLSVLQELAGVENGIEFTVDLEWTDDTHTVLNRIIRIRNRVGTAYLGSFGNDTNNPVAIFTMPGPVVDFQYVEDYSSENGANSVLATSSGEGDDRPESGNHVAGGVLYGYGGQMARFERRFTPSTSITNRDTLDDHARRELMETWDGLRELTLEADLDTAPRLNEDWWLGDDLGVSLTCPRFPERMSSDGSKVPGYLATERCIGWEIDFDARRLRPKVVELNEVEVETL